MKKLVFFLISFNLGLIQDATGTNFGCSTYSNGITTSVSFSNSGSGGFCDATPSSLGNYTEFGLGLVFTERISGSLAQGFCCN